MRKTVYIILIFSICIISFFSYASNEIQTNTNIEINGLELKKNEVQSQIDKSQEKIEEMQDDRTEGLKKIASLDEGIEKTENAILSLNTVINELSTKVEETQKIYDATNEEYLKQQDLLNKRLVASYKAGELQYLDVLLNSNSLSDFLSNYFYISEVINYDIKLLNDVEQIKNQIENQKNDLETKKQELESQKQEQLKTQKVLENNKYLRETYVKELTTKELKLQAKVDKYNKQIKEIEEEIRKLAGIKNFGEDYVGGQMIWPINNHYTITSKFGMRTHPITGVYKLHTGMDISARKGDDFLASAYGMVTKAGYNSAYGNMVIIDHGGRSSNTLCTWFKN